MKKTFIFFLGFILTISLTTTQVFASELLLRSEASTELPYLAPNLDDAKLYLLATEIQENTRATSSTYDIDDIYNMLVSIRSYINTSNTNTSSILSELEDLTGNGTAYNTHSMLMDMWMRIGGNSSLAQTYTIVDLLKDVDDVLNNSLISTDGNETYNITELLAGIYGIYATPRSIPDLYDRLVLLDAKIQNIEDYTSYISSDIYSIEDAISRLADIYASNDVVAAKQAQQQYEDESIADFTGSGTGAATTANKNDIKSISSTVKSGLNTGGSASNALGVFSYSGSEWDWFTITTANNLDTSVPDVPQPDAVYYNDTVTNNSNQSRLLIPLTQPIPQGTTYHVEVTINPTPEFPIWFRMFNQGNMSATEIGILSGGNSFFEVTHTATTGYYTLLIENIPRGTSAEVYIYSYEQTRKSVNSNIPDFISDHDRYYYNELLKEKK